MGIELTHREIDETQPSWEYSDQWDFIQIPLMEFVLLSQHWELSMGIYAFPLESHLITIHGFSIFFLCALTTFDTSLKVFNTHQTHLSDEILTLESPYSFHMGAL